MRLTTRHLCFLLAAGACGRSPAPSNPAPPPKPARPVAVEPTTGDRRALPVNDPLGKAAAATVDRQLAAYNAQDLEGFLATYADSVAVQNLGDTVAVEGKQALRQSTKEWFARAPEAKSQSVGRMVMGPFVVDHERLTGAPEGSPVDVIGIFEVRDSLIRRVWFVPPPPRTE
ncbi:MAG: nuclear transport factor 2 family protein [Gemmatimonadales bacterium]